MSKNARDVILARRAQFISAALAGIGLASVGCGSTEPAVCLKVSPEAAAVDAAQFEASPGPASADASNVEAAQPRPCLTLMPADAAPPQPCLKLAPADAGMEDATLLDAAREVEPLVCLKVALPPDAGTRDASDAGDGRAEDAEVIHRVDAQVCLRIVQ